MNEFDFEGRTYKLDDLSVDARRIVEVLNYVRVRLGESKNRMVVCEKAKQVYIQELKSEIISFKAGF